MRRLKGELIVYPCSGIRRCHHHSPFSIMNSRPIAIKFYLKHHLGGGKAAWGFGADRFRTLVSMATDSSQRVITEKKASSRFLECFLNGSFSYLQVTMTCMRVWMSSKMAGFDHRLRS